MKRLPNHTRAQTKLRHLYPMLPMPVIQRLNHIETRNRRRAKNKECDFERFDFVSVCEEQDWNCSICGEPLDWSLDGSDQMAISLDHKIGLAQGGSHTKRNAGAAHAICNSRKGHTFDAPNAAKVKRMAGETGQRARRERRKSEGRHKAIQTRGFQRGKSKIPSRPFEQKKQSFPKKLGR